MLEELNYAARIVGVKQLRRACTLAGIPVETAASARQLGQACGISVAATAAGVI